MHSFISINLAMLQLRIRGTLSFNLFSLLQLLRSFVQQFNELYGQNNESLKYKSERFKETFMRRLFFFLF